MLQIQEIYFNINFRSDFMTLPFEAVECYMANITPLQGKA